MFFLVLHTCTLNTNTRCVRPGDTPSCATGLFYFSFKRYHARTTQAHTEQSFTAYSELSFGLYKISFYFEAFVHESTILSFPAPTCIAHPGAILLHDYWAVYDPPPTFCLYAIHYTILVITISCKRQTLVLCAQAASCNRIARPPFCFSLVLNGITLALN